MKSSKNVYFKIWVGLFAVFASLFLAHSGAWAFPSYLTSFNNTYNATYSTSGSKLNACILCHTTSSGGTRNAYGSDFANASIGNHTFNTALANRDSDGDGFTNLAEIAALTFPGNASDYPAPAPDTTPPVVTAFTLPATSSSLTVSITTLTATDAVGVTGYMVTESSAAPASGAAGWVNPRPASYTFSTAGAKTLYAWAKDAAGNVSAGVSASVTITLPPPTPSTGDTQAPVVTAFQIELPLTWTGIRSQRTVNITAFTATDNVEVTAYLITTKKKKPSANNPAWSVTVPQTYTFETPGRKTLYSWAKDAAGNVSQGKKATVKISGVPIIPLPTGQQSFVYDASELSVQSASPASSQPMGVRIGDGVMTIQVHVGPFAGKVDAYVDLQWPAGEDGSPGPVLTLNDDGEFVPMTDAESDDSSESGEDDHDGDDSPSPWMTRKTVVNGFVFNNDSVSNLEPGRYTITLTVTPTGRPDRYYQWITTFDIP